MYNLKTSKESFYEYVGGSDGVGKSLLIKAINHSIKNYYDSIHGNNPDNLKVLLCAATGKAAFNIGWVTIHSAFAFPTQLSVKKHTELSLDYASKIRAKFIDLQLIIIDEILLVGSNTFEFINKRLQQIFTTTSDYGGKCILVFGDFFNCVLFLKILFLNQILEILIIFFAEIFICFGQSLNFLN